MARHIIETANRVARDVPERASLPKPVRTALSAGLEREPQSQTDMTAIVARHAGRGHDKGCGQHHGQNKGH